jgi:hypothetical protein
MPENDKKPTQKSALMDTLLRRQAGPNGPDWELAKAHMKAQMPKEMGGVGSIKPYGWWDFAKYDPDQVASTDVFNNIRYSPERILRYADGDQSKLDDVLAHELIHVRQNQEKPSIISRIMGALKDNYSNEYYQRPYEQEAYNHVDDRMRKRRDYELPPSNTKKIK